MKLKDIQNYLEEINEPYQVQKWLSLSDKNKYSVTLLNQTLYGEEFLTLINEFGMTLSDGFLWNVFEK